MGIYSIKLHYNHLIFYLTKEMANEIGQNRYTKTS